MATMRRATTAFLLVVPRLLPASPENSIVGLEGGKPAASGFPPDFRLHRSIMSEALDTS